MDLNYNDAQSMIQEEERIALEEFRNIPDDELLTIWEQTQSIEMEMRENLGAQLVFTPNYEKIILLELHSRMANNMLNISIPHREYKKLLRPRAKRNSPNPIIRRV